MCAQPFHVTRQTLRTGEQIVIASRPDLETAKDLAETLNKHAVGYLFEVQETRI